MDYKKTQEKLIKYICEICDYNSCNKNDYNRHLLTLKHKRMTNDDDKNSEKLQTYLCVCGKEYKYRQGLFKHKKKCNINKDEQINEIIDTKHIVDNSVKNNDDSVNSIISNNNNNNCNNTNTINYDKIILELINQNKELQKTINDMIPKIGNNINGNGNIIVGTMNNITLLNEKCKDALTMNDFIKMIEVDVSDLVYTSKKGLAQGVSQLFLEHYNNLPIIKRPLWCVDRKRKKLLIKEQEWLEDTDLKKTKEAIKNLGVIQAKSTNKYKNENPDWFESDKKKDMYLSIIKQTTDVIDDKLDKIVNSITDTIQLTDDVKDKIQQGE